MARLLLFIIMMTTIGLTAHSEKLTDNINYNIRLGYNIGGTAPVNMPTTIRGMDSFDQDGTSPTDLISKKI